jgi:hypothetical protein
MDIQNEVLVLYQFLMQHSVFSCIPLLHQKGYTELYFCQLC